MGKYMTISDAIRVLNVSRQTMMAWLEAGMFDGAYKEDKETAPWYIPAEAVERKRQELIAALEKKIRRLEPSVYERHDVDLLEPELS
jgi:hypothetical protein